MLVWIFALISLFSSSTVVNLGFSVCWTVLVFCVYVFFVPVYPSSIMALHIIMFITLNMLARFLLKINHQNTSIVSYNLEDQMMFFSIFINFILVFILILVERLVSHWIKYFLIALTYVLLTLIFWYRIKRENKTDNRLSSIVETITFNLFVFLLAWTVAVILYVLSNYGFIHIGVVWIIVIFLALLLLVSIVLFFVKYHHKHGPNTKKNKGNQKKNNGAQREDADDGDDDFTVYD